MLEDHTMEKKPAGRPVQTPAKGVGTDSKKGQDGNNVKLFPKSSRRRESNGASSSTKYEPNRKPVPQKSKTIDKRPRPRGQNYGCGKEDTKVMEEQDAEVGSVFIPGSKKQNLNHLLNFHYAPRDVASQWRSSGGQRWNRSGGIRATTGILAMSTHRHKYNKEQYLQANCQFVVKADGDYSPYANNPDTLVDWDLVEQIRVQGPQVPSCPICLSPPVAAKMTRCGHVYCWPCILHYLALSDKTWRKCPICFEAVHKQDLRSVVALPRVACNIMEDIEMRLMRREKGSLVVTPVEDLGTTVTTCNRPLSFEDENPASAYSKLLLATPVQVLSILDREKAELSLQMSEEVGCPEICFTEQALELLSVRENQLIQKNLEMEKVAPIEDVINTNVSCSSAPLLIQPKAGTIAYISAFDNITVPLDASPASSLTTDSSSFFGSDAGIHSTYEENSLRRRNESMSSEGLGSEDGGNWDSNITAEDLEMTNQSRINSPLTPNSAATNKYYYFYQAADGQHIYLHSLNVRMLEKGFGSLENCPRRVRGRVLEKEAGSMSIELRKRLRCFQHLPLACQFEVAEIQLQPPLVNKETLTFFKDQLDSRRRRRQKRAREEQRWEKKAAQVEARKWGHFPSARIRLESHHQFPECGTASSPETHNPYMSHAENIVVNEEVEEGDGRSRTLSPSLPDAFDGLNISDGNASHEPYPLADAGGHIEQVQERSGCWGSSNDDSGSMSFAQMLREGKSRAVVSETTTTIIGRGGRRQEGKAAILMEAASRAASAAARRHGRPGFASDDSDGECNDGQAPAFNQSFGDAIALALQKKDNIAGEAMNNQGKKKKKQKQKLLFNTNMAFIGK